MSLPSISVVMVTHNGERYLASAIDSILTQTFKDFEFIIIDDNSTDSTPQMLVRYAQSDPRIKLLANEGTLGLAASLNRGIAFANAPLIARMDDDDISVPDRLQKQMQFLRDHPEYVIVGSNYALIDKGGEPFGSIRLPQEDEDIRRTLFRTNPFCHPSVMMRKRILAEISGYDPYLRTSQDYDLWFWLLEKGKAWNIQEELMKKRVHPGMVSVRQKRVQVYNTLKIHLRNVRSGVFRPQFYFGLIGPIAGLMITFIPLRIRQFIWRLLR